MSYVFQNKAEFMGKCAKKGLSTTLLCGFAASL